MGDLVEMVKRHEGVKSKVYLCTAGFETIGVGRNISESGLGLSSRIARCVLLVRWPK